MNPSIRSSLASLLAAATLGACGSSADLVHYTVATNNRMVCCRQMSFSVGAFAATRPASADAASAAGEGVTVRFTSDHLVGNCSAGGDAPLVIANHSAEDVYIPTSYELEGSRIKLYPWRQHLDSAGRTLRLARQIQYGDLLERNNESRLRLMRLPAGREVALTAWVPGEWLCTKPTELYEGYLKAELDPAFYAQRARGLRSSRYEQARELVSPIPLRYDVVYVKLDFLESLPVASRVASAKGDTITLHLNVTEEPAVFLNAEQKVAESNLVEMIIEK